MTVKILSGNNVIRKKNDLRRLSCADFPWVLSNCDLKATGQPLGKCFHYVCINMPNGKKVGIIGLIEYEWLLTLASIDENEVKSRPVVYYSLRKM